jgi:hypothetical protein
MNIGTKEVIHESPICRVGNLNAEAPGVSVHRDVETCLSRRRETRVNEQKACVYSLCESLDGEQMTIEQGEVYSINRSEHGILVLMGGRPRERQLLELHIAETRWEYLLNLYEVQWTKIVPVESHGELFLVGCRLVFGASRYWAF